MVLIALIKKVISIFFHQTMEKPLTKIISSQSKIQFTYWKVCFSDSHSL